MPRKSGNKEFIKTLIIGWREIIHEHYVGMWLCL